MRSTKTNTQTTDKVADNKSKTSGSKATKNAKATKNCK
jgi:hypothetical protein